MRPVDRVLTWKEFRLDMRERTKTYEYYFYDYNKRGCQDWVMQVALPIVRNSTDAKVLEESLNELGLDDWVRSKLKRDQKERIANALEFMLFDSKGEVVSKDKVLYGSNDGIRELLD